jgi:two-component system response regulator LytT
MHVVIVEDEPFILQRLQRQVSEILTNKLDKLSCFDNLDDAQEYISEHTIDLLFLDLNLHGDDGFELLKTFTAASFHTIIVSASADEAINAFSYGVLDFVAKPFTKARLEQAINRVLDIKLRQDYGTRFLSIKQAGIIKLIEVSKIEYIVAAGHYSELVLKDATWLHDKSIQKLLSILPPNFEQIHRSYIVNMNNVSRLSFDVGSKYSIELENGKQLPIGRSRFSAIKDKLEK